MIAGDAILMDWSALASAFLGGSLGTLLTGWFDRRARRAEREADFQRETLRSILDTLEELIWDVQALETWRCEPEFWKTAIEQERAELPEAQRAAYVGRPFDFVAHYERLASSDGPLERFTKRRLRMEKLSNQVQDEQVRRACYSLSVIAREVIEKPAFDRSNALAANISERIGALLRGESGVMIALSSQPDAPPEVVSQRHLL